MTRFYFGLDKKGKLVRDQISPDLLREKHVIKSRKISGDEFLRELLKKFPEEFGEMLEAFEANDREEEKAELADLQSIIDAYIRARGFDAAEINRLKDEKIKRRGAFDKGLFVEWIDLKPDANNYQFWAKYYRDRPNQYLEEKENKQPI